MTELALRVGQASLRFGQRPAGPAHWEESLGLRYNRLAGLHYHGSPAPKKKTATMRDVALEEAGIQLTPQGWGPGPGAEAAPQQAGARQRLPPASREQRVTWDGERGLRALAFLLPGLCAVAGASRPTHEEVAAQPSHSQGLTCRGRRRCHACRT